MLSPMLRRAQSWNGSRESRGKSRWSLSLEVSRFRWMEDYSACFLRAGLIQRLIITRVPVIIGSGIPLFGELPNDLRVRHVATRSFPSGLVENEYHLEEGAQQD